MASPRYRRGFEARLVGRPGPLRHDAASPRFHFLKIAELTGEFFEPRREGVHRGAPVRPARGAMAQILGGVEVDAYFVTRHAVTCLPPRPGAFVMRRRRSRSVTGLGICLSSPIGFI